jgi:DNA-binding transcriptional MerR regulator
MTSTSQTFRTRAFAELAGITIRALHHYDRIGLLSPRRTAGGYREYSTEDLHVLEQIVVLKFIGFPLREIAALRQAGTGRLTQSLRAQQGTLKAKRRLLDQAIAAIEQLESAMASRSADPSMFRKIIEVIRMQNNPDKWRQQYDELVNRKIDRLNALSPEELAQFRADWNTLVAEIHEVLAADPAGPRAQQLGTRWQQLLGMLMGGQVSGEALTAHHTAQQWTPQMASFVDKQVWDYMTRVLTSRS